MPVRAPRPTRECFEQWPVADRMKVYIMDYATLTPLVGHAAPGAPIPRLLDALARCSRDFFRRSGVWQITAPPTPLRAEQRTYRLPMPQGADLGGVIEVRYAGRRLEPVLREQLFGDWERLQGAPDAYTMAVPEAPMQDYADPTYFPSDYMTGEPDEFAVHAPYEAIRLIPYPSEAYSHLLRVRYSVAPLPAATAVPLALGTRYQDALVTGAKAEVLRDAGQPWSDRQAAALFETEYRRLLEEACQDVIRGAGGNPRGCIGLEAGWTRTCTTAWTPMLRLEPRSR